MKLKEIATEIYQYLKTFENNPKINKVKAKHRTRPYYYVNCWATRKKVHIKYVSYHSASQLNKKEALEYLNWLKKGNIGKHYTMKGF